MNFENIDPMLGQTITQMIHLKQQLLNLRSVDTSVFLSAVTEFTNMIGNEMQRQASSESTWQQTSPNNITAQLPGEAIPYKE